MLSDKTILITGASGKSGSAAAKMCLDLGAKVILSDKKAASMNLPDSVTEEKCIDARPRDGEELLEEFSPDFIITAPGVPLSSPIFISAKRKQIPVYGENDFAYHVLVSEKKIKPGALFIGITGTDGKSTTTALMQHMLNAFGMKTAACGNFGTPLSELFFDPMLSEYDAFSVELSSYQLEPAQFFHPHVSMILNLAEDHMDRYQDMNSYLNAKLNILINQSAEDLLLAPRTIIQAAEEFLNKKKTYENRVRMESPEPFITSITCGNLSAKVTDFSLKGAHNLYNLSYVLGAVEDLSRRFGFGLSYENFISALRSFRGLRHRFEDAGQWNGVQFINDSKATTVQAVVTALNSLSDRSVFLLCGGKNKRLDFSVLAGRKDVNYYPFGESGRDIAEITGSKFYPDLPSAFQNAMKDINQDGVLLLSPGCASFDQYSSYEERGMHFCSLVEEWKKNNTISE